MFIFLVLHFCLYILLFVTVFLVCTITVCYYFAGGQYAGPLCGFSLPTEIIIPYSMASEINVVFRSDSAIQFDGFAIQVAFEEGKIKPKHRKKF